MELIHPFTCIVSGPTGCGKSVFVSKLIKENVVCPKPDRIVWCYGEYQKLYETLPQVEFVQGLTQDVNPEQNNLLIIDNLMSENDKAIANLFTKGSHHKNISVIYIVQNLFNKSKEHRTISLNSQYLVAFKNLHDTNQISALARQIYPKHSKRVLKAFADATSFPYGYLLFDFKQSTDEKHRLRSKIFPGENQIVYLPNHLR